MSKPCGSSQVWFCALVLALAGCASDTTGDDGRFDFDGNLGGVDGPADMISRARIVDDVSLDSTVQGNFERRIRVYGFTFEAKAGAVIHLDLEAFAGLDSIDRDAGEQLDTVASVYGPMDGDQPGAQLAYADDGEGGVKAELPAIEIVEDGRYLVALSSWDDPGTDGRYALHAQCEGTEFQCLRPVVDRPCREGTDYIVGGQTLGTATWDRCEVVLLEETHVAEGEVLTINPGVEVHGNYLGTDGFGAVALVVDGALQAVGTEEHPIRFSALRDGWRGLVLNGSSNTIRHAYVEQAHVGIEVHGTNNTFEQLNVNTSETGLSFEAGSGDNSLRGLTVVDVRNGIRFDQSGATIEDSIVKGRYDGEGIGIEGLNGGPSLFARTLVAGFGDGMHLTTMAFEVTDGMIINNTRGVTVTGEDAGVNPEHTCPAFPRRQPTPRPGPPPRTSWGPDPIFVRCDFLQNTEYAVRINAPELLIIEDSNIVSNGAGVIVAADELHPDSHITGNNIYGNGDAGVQLLAQHQHGTLDISGNYWAQISDPQLSASWDVDHDEAVTCRQQWPSNRDCRWNGTFHQCGEWRCDRQGQCTASVGVQWSSEVGFAGFSPVELDAGVRLDDCADDVVTSREDELARE